MRLSLTSKWGNQSLNSSLWMQSLLSFHSAALPQWRHQLIIKGSPSFNFHTENEQCTQLLCSLYAIVANQIHELFFKECNSTLECSPKSPHNSNRERPLRAGVIDWHNRKIFFLHPTTSYVLKKTRGAGWGDRRGSCLRVSDSLSSKGKSSHSSMEVGLCMLRGQSRGPKWTKVERRGRKNSLRPAKVFSLMGLQLPK
jgi:hypothetical protein